MRQGHGEAPPPRRPRLRRLRGISLFHVASIDIRLDASWFLVFLLVLASLSAGYLPRMHPGHSPAAYVAAGAAATLLFFLSVLAHELAHALVAIASGIRVPAITLFLFGGVSHMEEEPRRPATELRVALAGPLTSFALALAFWVLGRSLPQAVPTLARAVVEYLAWINAALGVFNLLPGFPLDGGRILRALLWWRTGSLRRATRTAADAGKGLAVGLMLLGGVEVFLGALISGLWLIFIGLFLRTMAEASYQNLVLLQTFEDVTVEEVAIPEPVTVPSGLTILRLVDEYILPRGYRAFPVVDGGIVQGLISIADLRELPREQWESTSVRERMTPLGPEICVAADAALTDALKQLVASRPERLLVMRGDRLVGMLTRSGLARFVEIRHVLDEA